MATETNESELISQMYGLGSQKVNDEEYINKMYDSNLASQKQTLQTDYDTNVSNLDAEKQQNQKQTDTNLTRAYVEAAKAQKGYNEVQNAYGLTSGAMAQARLAQDNQLQSNLTTLRTAQQTADAEIERQRSLLAKEYASAIAKAQADNDMQRAQALYEAAKADENRLLQLQKEAGELMATKNDYAILGQLYGLTQEQIDKLQGTGGGGGYEAPKKTYSADPDPEIDIEAEYQLIKNNTSASAGDQYLKSAISAGLISLADATELRDKRY